MNIYLADLIVSERKAKQRSLHTCRVFIKEIKSPLSLRLATIAPTNFADSLRFLKQEKETFAAMDGEVRFRTVQCQEHARLYFLFKSVNQRYMFSVKLDLKKRAIVVTSYEWNDLQQKYKLLYTNELLAIERQLIYHILQSIYICQNNQVAYFSMFRAKQKR
ncbi:hypothetical protein [Anoxybacteroides tepidamans]|uniref:hypothetical protein n=1 Tax=Anoxybacteroides tepidamans TaxID=265948 RepID=UPI0004860B79|nr:hypothetical protein [Anoxybacillus tepidamans]